MNLAFLLPALVAWAPEKDGVTYVDASLEPDGRVLGARFHDVDGDGRLELCLALARDGERELRFHRLAGGTLDPQPFRTVGVKADVIAFALADVRDEAGDELLFLTREGFYSYSLTHEGYRGNIAPLVRTELLYDVADPDELPEWRFVLPSQWGQRILVPGREGVSVWGRDEAARPREASYEALARFRGEATRWRYFHHENDEDYEEHGEERRDPDASREAEFSVGSKGLEMRLELDGDTLLLPEAGAGSFRLLSSRNAYAAPALADVDGDGNKDLLFAVNSELRVHLARAAGFADEPDRTEQVPAYLGGSDGEATPSYLLADLDGDGDTDLVARSRDDSEGFGNSETTLLVLVNDGARLLPATPDQVLRFRAAHLRVELVDVDGDGRLDLALRKLELPGVVEAVSGIELTLTHLVYLGRAGDVPFEKKPVLRQSERFDETSLGEIVANRELQLDCDGDGVADLVEVDLEGRIAIRRLQRTSSFFGGDSWKLETAPWKRFDVYGSVESVRVRDLNGDGLGDVISAGPRALTVLLSSVRGER